MTGDAEPLTISIDGHLDVAAARSAAERAASAARGRKVVFEFGPRAECELVALSFLAEVIRALERGGSRVEVRGLSAHHVGILVYLGVPFRRGPKPNTDD